MTRLAIGLDPGLGESGLVASFLEGHELTPPVDWATYTCPPGDPDLTRALAMASCLLNRIMAWVQEYQPDELDISVELPVYTGNPLSFTKQVRLIEEIESGLFYMVAGEVGKCWLTEVNPATSKSLAGCGPREKPVAQSPFAREPQGITQSTRKTLADAWAHSLATYGGGGTRLALHQASATDVQQVHTRYNTGPAVFASPSRGKKAE